MKVVGYEDWKRQKGQHEHVLTRFEIVFGVVFFEMLVGELHVTLVPELSRECTRLWVDTLMMFCNCFEEV